MFTGSEDGGAESMLVCMRTTINLPDSLSEAVKARAASEGKTFTSLVEEGLRAVLQAHEHTPQPSSPLPSYGDRGGRPLIEIMDRDALWAALDADGHR